MICFVCYLLMCDYFWFWYQSCICRIFCTNVLNPWIKLPFIKEEQHFILPCVYFCNLKISFPISRIEMIQRWIVLCFFDVPVKAGGFSRDPSDGTFALPGSQPGNSAVFHHLSISFKLMIFICFPDFLIIPNRRIAWMTQSTITRCRSQVFIVFFQIQCYEILSCIISNNLMYTRKLTSSDRSSFFDE